MKTQITLTKFRRQSRYHATTERDKKLLTMLLGRASCSAEQMQILINCDWHAISEKPDAQKIK